MAPNEHRTGVYLRLHPDGHWMPDTVGRWRWKPRECADDKRVTPMEFEVFELHGGLMIRPAVKRGPLMVCPVADVPYRSIRMAEPGEWEWITPTGEEESSDDTD